MYVNKRVRRPGAEDARTGTDFYLANPLDEAQVSGSYAGDYQSGRKKKQMGHL